MNLGNEYRKIKNEIIIHSANIASSSKKVKELKQNHRKLLYTIFNDPLESNAIQIQHLKSLNQVLIHLDQDNPDFKRTTNIFKKIDRIWNNLINHRIRSKKLMRLLEVPVSPFESQSEKSKSQISISEEIKHSTSLSSFNQLPDEMLQCILEAPILMKRKKEVRQFFPNIIFVSKAFAKAAMKVRFTYLKTDQACFSDFIGNSRISSALSFINQHGAKLSTVNLIAYTSITLSDIKQIKRDCPHLKKLHLTGLYINNDVNNEVSSLTNLKFLQFYNCQNLNVFNASSTSIKTLTFKRCSDLTSISLNALPNLKKLRFQSAGLSIRNAEIFPSSFPSSLENLNITGPLPKDLFLRLSSSLLNKLYLNTTDQSITTLDASNFPYLKKFTFISDCPSDLDFLSMMPALEELNVQIMIATRFDNFSSLNSINLKVLKIMNCVIFKKFNFSLPKNMKSLEITNCKYFKSEKELSQLSNECTIKLQSTGLSDFEGTIQEWKTTQASELDSQLSG